MSIVILYLSFIGEYTENILILKISDTGMPSSMLVPYNVIWLLVILQ